MYSFFPSFLRQCLSPTLFCPVLGPEREVISVYNEDFTTPCNRTPYFIEVYRCVKDNGSRCSENQTVEDFIVPNETENITIVVPDTGNKTEFYSYVIYNHTSCKCGTMDKRKERPEPAFTKGWFI